MTTRTETLRLHGRAVSNYFNIVRAALIEKGLLHEVVTTPSSQDSAFLALSPMGKIPLLEVETGWVSETVAILEYLDDRYPATPLRPDDAVLRARGRQLINIIQVYLEIPSRNLFSGVFGGGDNPPQTVAASRAMLDRVTSALTRLAQPAPYLLGEAVSQADLTLFYHLDIADRVSRFVYDRSIRDEIGGLETWDALMRERASTRIVLAEFDESFAAYLAEHNAAYRDDAPDAAPITPGRLHHA